MFFSIGYILININYSDFVVENYSDVSSIRERSQTADESWQKYVFWFARIWHSLINSMHSIARKCKTRLILAQSSRHFSL